MKYFLILLLACSFAASADFVVPSNNAAYAQSDYLLKVRNRKKTRVVMYSYSWCPYCAKARHYFRANRIPFIEYDLDRDRAAKRRYNAMRGRVTPLIIVGRQRLNGFSVPHFRRIYR